MTPFLITLFYIGLFYGVACLIAGIIERREKRMKRTLNNLQSFTQSLATECEVETCTS